MRPLKQLGRLGWKWTHEKRLKNYGKPGRPVELAMLLILLCFASLYGPPLIRFPAAFLFAAVVPGHLVLLLLPDEAQGGRQIFRPAMILPTSAAAVSLILLILHYARLYSVQAVMGSVLLLDFCLLAAISVRHPRGTSLRTPDWAVMKDWLSGHPARWSGGLFLAALIGLAASLLYAGATPARREPLSEFYVLDASERVPVGLTELELRESGLVLGIVNREGGDMVYQLEVIGYEGEAEQRLWSEVRTVGKGAVDESWLDLGALPTGIEKLEFVLRGEDDEAEEPYRQLTLYLEPPSMNDPGDWESVR